MNFNKDLYEKSEAKEFGERENLSLGGHEVVIMDAREYESPLSGNISLKVCVDIGGSDKQAGYFKKQYEETKANAGRDIEVKWPNGATRFLSLKDENLSYLKGFITSLENSNNGFKFDPNGNWEQLKNLKCAGIFGLEEYRDNENKVKTFTRLTNFRSLDKLKEITIPKVKTIDGDYVDYEDYQEFYANKPLSEAPKGVEITPDQLPF